MFDNRNPRLPTVEKTQEEVARAIVKGQRSKISNLATHMLENGPNPASLPIVMPSPDEPQAYIVLDGNRRLAALHLLRSPILAEGLLPPGALRRLNRLATAFARNPITSLPCMIVADRDEADIWIPLIHRGQQDGAGLVAWDGQVAARYDARKAKRSTTAALQILDYVKANATLSSEARHSINEGKFPITSLARLVNTPHVRAKLGIDTSGSLVTAIYPKDELVKGLTRVVEDLATGEITVSDIKRQEQRIEYIDRLSKGPFPDPRKVLPEPKPLAVIPLIAPPSITTPIKPTPPERSRQRSTLIPPDCRLNVTPTRIQKIYKELRRLDLDDFPNAGAVMLRVFLELTLDHYLEAKAKWSPQQVDNSSLGQKLSGALTRIEAANSVPKAALAPVKKAASGQTLLAASVKTMHGYVHNRFFSPVASELKIAWDDLQPFIEALWAA